MKIVVLADEAQWRLLTTNAPDVQWVRVRDFFLIREYPYAAAFLVLDENTKIDCNCTQKPIFINSVITTLAELKAPQNVFRINGWNTFLQRNVWEIAGIKNEFCSSIAQKINKKIIWVQDEPGLIAAKIVAMIINEAYFALGDGVSSAADIDTAMQLGTHYPYGPFEWAKKIGEKNIYRLLSKLSATDKSYLPAPLLLAAANKNNP